MTDKEKIGELEAKVKRWKCLVDDLTNAPSIVDANGFINANLRLAWDELLAAYNKQLKENAEGFYEVEAVRAENEQLKEELGISERQCSSEGDSANLWMNRYNKARQTIARMQEFITKAQSYLNLNKYGHAEVELGCAMTCSAGESDEKKNAATVRSWEQQIEDYGKCKHRYEYWKEDEIMECVKCGYNPQFGTSVSGSTLFGTPNPVLATNIKQSDEKRVMPTEVKAKTEIEDLKPCPSCGVDDEEIQQGDRFQDGNNDWYVAIKCYSCGRQGPWGIGKKWNDAHEAARDAWNEMAADHNIAEAMRGHDKVIVDGFEAKLRERIKDLFGYDRTTEDLLADHKLAERVRERMEKENSHKRLFQFKKTPNEYGSRQTLVPITSVEELMK